MKTHEAPRSDDTLVDPSAAAFTCPDEPPERPDDRQAVGRYQSDRDDRTPEEAGYGYGV